MWRDLHQRLARIEASQVEHAPVPGIKPKKLGQALERRHEGRTFIQHGQNRVSGLGRKHHDDPINAGVTVAF
jgi:hypothetical protein